MVRVKLTWSGPPLLPKSRHERFHLHLAPAGERSVESTLELVLAGGASLGDGRHDPCPDAVTLAGVDGNQLCLVPPR